MVGVRLDRCTHVRQGRLSQGLNSAVVIPSMPGTTDAPERSGAFHDREGF